MKRIAILSLLLMFCLPAAGQRFDPEHRHSIEISTGIPPLHTFMLGANGSSQMYGGFRESTNFIACINLGYTYAINEKWDFNFVFDLTQKYYTRQQYAKASEEAEGYELYDYKSGPISTKSSVYLWPSYMADFRWKWYCSDSVRLYTSFGLSYLPFVWPIFPNLTPIGINFGRNHFYGVAEISLSTAATLALVGVGYRF